jgi:hypothetical protein
VAGDRVEVSILVEEGGIFPNRDRGDEAVDPVPYLFARRSAGSPDGGRALVGGQPADRQDGEREQACARVVQLSDRGRPREQLHQYRLRRRDRFSAFEEPPERPMGRAARASDLFDPHG